MKSSPATYLLFFVMYGMEGNLKSSINYLVCYAQWYLVISFYFEEDTQSLLLDGHQALLPVADVTLARGSQHLLL